MNRAQFILAILDPKFDIWGLSPKKRYPFLYIVSREGTNTIFKNPLQKSFVQFVPIIMDKKLAMYGQHFSAPISTPTPPSSSPHLSTRCYYSNNIEYLDELEMQKCLFLLVGAWTTNLLRARRADKPNVHQGVPTNLNRINFWFLQWSSNQWPRACEVDTRAINILRRWTTQKLRLVMFCVVISGL